MNKERKRKYKIRYFRVGAAVFLLVLIFFGIALIVSSCGDGDGNKVQVAVITDTTTESFLATSENITESITEDTAASFVVYPKKSSESVEFSEDYDAVNAVLMCVEDNEIIAYRENSTRMYPASLTKVMSLIVAVENISDLSDTVLITNDMVGPMIAQNASRAGFVPGETPTLRDLLYGMILTSGADASLAVAEYVSGSEAAFAELMNAKAEEMGLRDTHFTNCTGLHHEKHYSTADDMALILEYAIRNDICRAVLTEYEYNYPPTQLNPEGLKFTSTLFERMYGDEMSGVLIKGGKTGYTDESGNCIESFAEIGGKTYILVLCGGTTKWNNIYNTLSAYSVYCAKGEPYSPPNH
ncbi:MAG: D-alanyl-D-alanine carboxypeptidase [Ruminococcus sp.]|nr:D-alanyl-D-alanine carboxypeptidase [Ruminococcus sp.]